MILFAGYEIKSKRANEPLSKTDLHESILENFMRVCLDDLRRMRSKRTAFHGGAD
jgi:hypothetical protein